MIQQNRPNLERKTVPQISDLPNTTALHSRRQHRRHRDIIMADHASSSLAEPVPFLKNGVLPNPPAVDPRWAPQGQSLAQSLFPADWGNDLQQVFGWVAVVTAGLFFGSSFVPAKKYDSGNGLFFQWLMCTGIFVVGLLLQVG